MAADKKELDVLVIGSSNVDLIMQVKRLPKAGESISHGIFKQVLGGKGANQAVAAARMGSAVAFIACLGNDAYARQMLDAFQKDKIDTIYMVQDPHTASGTAMISIDQEGEHCICVAPGANHQLRPKHIDAAYSLFEQTSYILLQCELAQDTLEYTINFANKLGKPIILNLAPAIPMSDSYLSRLHCLILNESEAEFLCNFPVQSLADVKKASIHLRKKVSSLIITLGAQGAFLSSEELEKHITAFPVQALDSTAAGDVFCGAYVSCLCRNMSVNESLVFASAASAIAVSRLGAQSSIPARTEVEQFLQA